ncbi:carboxypeptidase-like regulatory domain-containing protein [Gimesia maris]|uniref:carboxypeptidase-like regulatory domain-containing protein n=1 Tax=Gimesia maris TaxID=122 RepID=UPI0030D9AB7D
MPELGQVHGTITLDGKPLEGVSVLFEPENGRPSTAITDAAGKYEAQYLIDEPGVKLGPGTVRVEWGIDATGPKIPNQYGSKSELKLEVQPGENEFNIDMQSK